MSDYLTFEEAAAYLGIAEEALRVSWMKGTLPGRLAETQSGRLMFPKSELVPPPQSHHSPDMGPDSDPEPEVAQVTTEAPDDSYEANSENKYSSDVERRRVEYQLLAVRDPDDRTPRTKREYLGALQAMGARGYSMQNTLAELKIAYEIRQPPEEEEDWI